MEHTVGRIVHVTNRGHGTCEAAVVVAVWADENGPGVPGINVAGWHADGAPFVGYSLAEGAGAGTFHDPRECSSAR